MSTLGGGGRRTLVLVAAFVVMSAVACGSEDPAPLVTPGSLGSTASPGAATVGPASQSPAPAGPTLTLEQPQDGATVEQGKLTIDVKVGGFQLVNKVGQAPSPGEGHLIFYAGVDFIPTRPGQSARTDPSTSTASDQPTSSWPSLAPGKYGIGAQLVNNDDTPLVPPVTVQATVTIR